MISKPYPLGLKLAIAFGVFALSLSVALGLYVDQFATSRLLDAQQKQLKQAADRMAERLHQDVQTRLREVTMIAADDTMADPDAAISAKRDILERLKASMSKYAWIGLTDANGKVLAATGGILEGRDASARPWFKAASEKPVLLDVHKALMLQEYLAPDAKEPLRFVDAAAPLFDENHKFVGVLVGHLSWAWAAEVQRSILASVDHLVGAELLVLDINGEVLLGPPDLTGQTLETASGVGILAASGQSTTSYVTATAVSNAAADEPGLGWRVVARQPMAAAVSPIIDAQLRGALGGGMIALLFALIGVAIASSISRPLRLLASAAKAVQKDPEASIPRISSYREADDLGNALSTTVEALRHERIALKSLNESLAKQVLDQTADLRDAKEAAEQAALAKAELLATMSHEVRTPLSGIIGFTDLLLADETLGRPHRRRLEQIQSAGSLLTAVINDILDFSKIEAGRMEVVAEPLRLDSVVDSCISALQARAEANELCLTAEFAHDLPGGVLGDEIRLRQVLLNLTGNAIKFTKAGSVKLRVERDPDGDDGDRIRFSVTDTGIGIATEKLDRLFKRFSQVDQSIEREYGGTGLGLAISQRIVGMMGGQIVVESRQGLGSTFSFSIAMPEVSVRDQAPLKDADLAGSRLRILLVEDVVANQEIAVAMLAAGGHDVDAVGDGLAAIEAVCREAYDLVLMDVHMPGMNGISATRAIRALPHAASVIPILALTANVMPEQIRAFLAAGMNGHVGKPIRRSELLQQVARFAPAPARAGQGEAGIEDLDTSDRFDPKVLDELDELLGPDKVASFMIDLSSRVETLARSHREMAAADIAEAAHKLVGLAGTLGFTGLARRCQALEAAFDQGEVIEGHVRDVMDGIPETLRLIANDLNGRGELAGRRAKRA